MIARSNATEIHKNIDRNLQSKQLLNKIPKNAKHSRNQSLGSNRKMLALEDALQDPVTVYEGS